METKLVLFEELSNKVGIITLNDPNKLNAMSEAMAEEFSALIKTLKSRATSLRAVILTGAGKAFSAGGDLKMLESKTKLGGEENRQKMLAYYNSFLCIRELNVPLIAAVNGSAIGAGLCLASACDVRLAGESAKLGMTFAKLGLHPGMGATYFLPQVMGYARAAEFMLTARVVDAAEALRVGLVSRIVSDAVLMDEAKNLAQEICNCGPEAVTQLLETLRTGTLGLDQSLKREASVQAVNYAGAEFKEGLSSVIEKRKPRFD
jgi:enoyl-CoA hydratase